MTEQTVERTTVARWESDSGKHWVELYSDKWGYGYNGVGCGGFLGKYDTITRDQAIARIERDTVGGAAVYHPGKRPMRRTV